MFPLGYCDEIEVAHIKKSEADAYRDRFLVTASEELEKIKGRDIKIENNKVLFSGGFFGSSRSMGILTPIRSGYIEVLSSENGLSISYFINFRELFVFSTMLTAIIGITLFQKNVFSPANNALSTLAVWLILFGVNWLIGMIGFLGFAERLIEETRLK